MSYVDRFSLTGDLLFTACSGGELFVMDGRPSKNFAMLGFVCKLFWSHLINSYCHDTAAYFRCPPAMALLRTDIMLYRYGHVWSSFTKLEFMQQNAPNCTLNYKKIMGQYYRPLHWRLGCLCLAHSHSSALPLLFLITCIIAVFFVSIFWVEVSELSWEIALH